jgi:ectoine hydroxylase-related dioxygenase (phytanoyl-CoA dioxygenase family)
MGSLNKEQIEHFEEYGYVIVREVLNRDEIDRYLRRAREIALGDLPEGAANRLVKDIHFAKAKLPMPDDPEHALWKIMNPDRFDATMAECMRFPKVMDAVSSLIGDDLMAFLLMFIYKPPGVPGSLHPFHQDAAYFTFGPQEQCLGVWIPLDPVNEANGSLCVVPGSHRLPVRKLEFKDGVNFGALASEGAEEDDEFHDRSVTLDLPAGDCVLFSTHLLHRTGGNVTTGHRRVVTLHMASAQCKHKGQHFSEFAFTSVRGRTYEGCLKSVENPSMRLENTLIGG